MVGKFKFFTNFKQKNYVTNIFARLKIYSYFRNCNDIIIMRWEIGWITSVQITSKKHWEFRFFCNKVYILQINLRLVGLKAYHLCILWLMRNLMICTIYVGDILFTYFYLMFSVFLKVIYSSFSSLLCKFLINQIMINCLVW